MTNKKTNTKDLDRYSHPFFHVTVAKLSKMDVYLKDQLKVEFV